MRLLNTETRQLEEPNPVPKYAILSHTWGNEEITFNDLQNGTAERFKEGYSKLDGFCKRASENGYGYVWIDTCCIGKSSSAELSEAINSMFSWYQGSDVCYIYLDDVPTDDDVVHPASAFCKSRWFNRGWTLQELIASRKRLFFSASWDLLRPSVTKLGKVGKLRQSARVMRVVETITGIPVSVIDHSTTVFQYSVATRMSWASKRKTTRVEDEAYCLMGLFQINMPLMYGEGPRAMRRLQEEIIRSSTDQSILAWGYNHRYSSWPGYLAASVKDFADINPILEPRNPSTYVRERQGRLATHSTVTNQGLHITMPIKELFGDPKTYLGLLDAFTLNGRQFALHLIPTGPESNLFARAPGSAVVTIEMGLVNHWEWERRQIYIRDFDLQVDHLSRMHTRLGSSWLPWDLVLSGPAWEEEGWKLSSCYPPTGFEPYAFSSKKGYRAHTLGAVGEPCGQLANVVLIFTNQKHCLYLQLTSGQSRPSWMKPVNTNSASVSVRFRGDGPENMVEGALFREDYSGELMFAMKKAFDGHRWTTISHDDQTLVGRYMFNWDLSIWPLHNTEVEVTLVRMLN
ncbi:hypothetical protein JX266_007497 [Neoarthrinium moseri]|nr:hypothetical protein JX266_007497 [Neoarthrinium moseri]